MNDETEGRSLRRPTEAPKLYAQDGKGLGAEVFAHYFLGQSDWLITEYDPEEDVAFGWACLNGDRQNAELGYVSMAELESVRSTVRLRDLKTGKLLESREGPGVELETDWPPRGTTLEQAISELDKRHGA